MNSMTLTLTSAAIALAVTLAGCVEERSSGDEGLSGQDFTRSCHVNLLSVSEIPENAYVLKLDPGAWRENASLLEAKLQEFEAKNGSLPSGIGGTCQHGYEDEVRWMISRYEEDPEARTTETRPNVHKFFFSLDHQGMVYGMSVAAYFYGYDQYPG